MALDKGILHGKEHRKPYYGAEAVDATCRPHGSCPWCQAKRLHKNKKRYLTHSTDDDIMDT